MKNLASPFVSGVLRRFAVELKVDPFVAYRAFVDRAHEACVVRKQNAFAFAPAILVTTQTIGGIAHVSICDNGEAIAAGDVRQLYRSIQTGRAGAVQRAIAASGVEHADEIVGQVGVALLAAFGISDQVTIATRAHAVRPEAGIRFVCNSRSYCAEPHRLARPGTVVQMRIRPEYQSAAAVDVLRTVLGEHAQTLTLPVHINV
jgi:HSP90 family molecular chaperone